MQTNLRHRLRRLYYGAWSQATPAFRISWPDRLPLAIPGGHKEAARLANWSPNWKSRLIVAVLANRPGAFLDVGANIGQTLVDFLASRYKRRYVAFEPNPRCVALLDELVRVNALAHCVVVPVGLSNRTCLASLLSRPGSATDAGASFDAGLRPGRALEGSLVPCFRFDDIRASLGLDGIALVKIDVEGTELAVLQGMRRTLARSAPWIVCEVLHRDRLVSAERHQRRLDGLESYLREVDYAILQVRVAADGDGHIELAALDAFPNEVYSAENGGECDYLFVPRDDAQAAAGLTGARPDGR